MPLNNQSIYLSNYLYINISLENLGVTPPPKQNIVSRQQTAQEHGKKVAQHTCRFPSLPAQTVPMSDKPKDTQHLETPGIYLISQEQPQPIRSKKLQTLEDDLHRLCAAADRTITKGKIEASKGRLANRVFSGELKLIGFPNNYNDFVLVLKRGVAQFYSVNKITKCINKRRRLPEPALISAVYCNVLYFPCYVDVKTMKMNFIKEDIIVFSGNVCDLGCTRLK